MVIVELRHHRPQGKRSYCAVIINAVLLFILFYFILLRARYRRYFKRRPTSIGPARTGP
jgi:preprotein translocase subunit YajC